MSRWSREVEQGGLTCSPGGLWVRWVSSREGTEHQQSSQLLSGSGSRRWSRNHGVEEEEVMEVGALLSWSWSSSSLQGLQK